MPRLRRTWKGLRKELTKSDFRDCVDYVELDLYGDAWLGLIRQRIVSGTYRPEEPGRREAAKSNGVFRVITSPAIDDLLVYRHICDEIYSRAQVVEPRGSFFSRRHRREPIGQKIDRLADDDYETFFEIWLRYDEYRRRLLMNEMFQYILITDIANYFEEIQHPLLLEYLSPYQLPREALGILGQLLSVLRPSTGHSPAPAVGIPLDQFDCSRILAHVFLFEHDARIVGAVGESGFVRWMDDQTIGVATLEDSRKVTRQLVESLARQRLTLNSAKTRVLNPTDVAAHFWLAHNTAMNAVEERLLAGQPPEALRLDVLDLWASFKATEKSGNWDKIAARLLALAARTGCDVADLDDLKQLLTAAPARAERLLEYLLARRNYDDYIGLFEWFLTSGNSLYEDVEAKWFELLLRVSPPRRVRPAIRDLAVEFLRGSKRGTGRPGARVPAALLLYWIGDGRKFASFEELLSSGVLLDGPSRRAVTAILCAVEPERLDRWLTLAGRQASTHVSSLVEWLTRARDGESFRLPSPLTFVKRPWLLDRYLYDARAWLRVELLAFSADPPTRQIIIREVLKMLWNPLLPTESLIVRRLESRLDFRFRSGSVRRISV